MLVAPRVDRDFARRVVGADLVVSWFWTKRLPVEVVTAARLGGFGVHPSLLPRWRGPDPYFWAIDAGDRETGVTAHRLDAAYDTGAVLGSRTLRIDPAWDAWQLARALDRPSLALLREVAARFAGGEAPAELRQEESLATVAPAPDEALLELDWRMDAASIVRRVRAAAPYPGAWTFIADEAVVLARVEETDLPRALAPGQAAVVRGRALVACGEGAVVLLSGRRIDEHDVEHAVDAAGFVRLVEAARTE